jgi:hypothetical protein
MQTEQDGQADFDFIMGRWKVHNRCLRARLEGSNDWYEFEGTSVARKVLGGIGNIDEITFDRETGPIEGMALRLFDPKSQEWSIYWSSSTTGVLDTPMIGKFENGRGEFFAQELHEDKHVYSRFIWSEITENTCRWEQALSQDGGKTWETNWIMEFTRLKE